MLSRFSRAGTAGLHGAGKPEQGRVGVHAQLKHHMPSLVGFLAVPRLTPPWWHEASRLRCWDRAMVVASLG